MKYKCIDFYKNMKHPLENTWTIWYYETEKNTDWSERQKYISDFSTIEDFWCLYNFGIKKPLELNIGCDYSIFKKGIKPMWEDSANKNGGRWLLYLNKQQSLLNLNDFWLEILMCIIGKGFDKYSNEICGAVITIRKNVDKFALWTKNDKLEGNDLKNIGLILQTRLITLLKEKILKNQIEKQDVLIPEFIYQSHSTSEKLHFINRYSLST